MKLVPGDPFAFGYGEHFSAIGTTGAGKTFMTKNAILPWHYRFIVVDSKARASGESFDFTEKAFVKCDVRHAIKFAGKNKNFRLRIPTKLGDEGFQEVEDLAEGLLKQNGHDCLVYLDEITDMSDAWQIGPMLQGLIRKARGYNISVGVGSQKPAGVSGWFLDNSAHIFIFGMKQSEVARFTKRTGAEWVAEVQPEIPIGSYKFAHQDFQDKVTVFDPVAEYPWGSVE